jgi:transcriptional regulator with XRE-family HTH domain
MALGRQLRDARMGMNMTASEVAAATRMKVQIVEAIEREDFSAIAAPIYGKGFIKLYAEAVGMDPRPLIEEFMADFVPQKKRGLDCAAPRKDASERPAAAAPAAPAPSPQDGAGDDLFSAAAPAGGKPAAAAAAATAAAREPRAAGTSWMRQARAACMAAVGWCTTRLGPWCERCRTRVTATCERASAEARRIRLRDIRFAEAPGKTLGVLLGILLVLVFVFSALSRYLVRPEPEPVGPGASLTLAADPPAPYFDAEPSGE